MNIETERLNLKPLSLIDLRNYQEDRSFFADTFGIKKCVGSTDDFMKNIFNIKIRNIEKDPDNWLMYTYWIIIDKIGNEEIGLVGFKEIPDENGRSEIGYGIEKEFQGKGYMTEALNGFCKWNFMNLSLKTIIASVSKCNTASINVLKKNGFNMFGEDENYFWYELNKS